MPLIQKKNITLISENEPVVVVGTKFFTDQDCCFYLGLGNCFKREYNIKKLTRVVKAYKIEKSDYYLKKRSYINQNIYTYFHDSYLGSVLGTIDLEDRYECYSYLNKVFKNHRKNVFQCL